MIREDAKRLYVLLSVAVFSLTVTYIDAFVQPPYFSKIPIKIVFFLLLPMLFFGFFKDEFKEFKALFIFKGKGLLTSLLIGLVIYMIIVGGFLLTRSFIDFSSVTSNLTDEMGISADNFLYVAVYISIMNSFLEEFFFRGFGFITLKKFFSLKFAYFFSPLFFAIYHVGMMLGMFHPAVLLLLLAGLVAGGVIFNFLNHRFGNIYQSWFAHMFANFAINTVGCILFGII